LIIDGKLKIYRNETIFDDSEIYDIKKINNHIYFSSSKGVFKYNLELNEIKLIDSNTYYNIEVFESYILGSNKNLWYIDTFGRELISNNINYFNVSPNGDRICASDFNEIKVIDFDSKDEWFLNLNGLNLNEPIYSIDCDNEWVWFSNSRGVSFFKWSNYEK